MHARKRRIMHKRRHSINDRPYNVLCIIHAARQILPTKGGMSVWRVFFILLILLLFLSCTAPVRAALFLRYSGDFDGMLCISIFGIRVYEREIRFLHPEAGRYALGFYNKKGKLKDTVTLLPPPKKEPIPNRLLAKQEVGKILHMLFRQGHFRHIEINVKLASTDAAVLAQSYGVLCAAANGFTAWASAKQIPTQIKIQPDFNGSKSAFTAGCMVCAPLGKLLVSALGARLRREKKHGKTPHRKHHACNA